MILKMKMLIFLTFFFFTSFLSSTEARPIKYNEFLNNLIDSELISSESIEDVSSSFNGQTFGLNSTITHLENQKLSESSLSVDSNTSELKKENENNNSSLRNSESTKNNPNKLIKSTDIEGSNLNVSKTRENNQTSINNSSKDSNESKKSNESKNNSCEKNSKNFKKIFE